MADEQTKSPFNKSSIIPKGFDWQSFFKKDGEALEVQYGHILENLSKEKGMLGVIFRKSQNKIQDPAKLKRLIMLINDETWVGLEDSENLPAPDILARDIAENLEVALEQFSSIQEDLDNFTAFSKPLQLF